MLCSLLSHLSSAPLHTRSRFVACFRCVCQQACLDAGDIRKDLLESATGDGFVEKFDKTEIPPQELLSNASIAALIFAGLYPNVARLDPPKNASQGSTRPSGSESHDQVGC